MKEAVKEGRKKRTSNMHTQYTNQYVCQCKSGWLFPLSCMLIYWAVAVATAAAAVIILHYSFLPSHIIFGNAPARFLSFRVLHIQHTQIRTNRRSSQWFGFSVYMVYVVPNQRTNIRRRKLLGKKQARLDSVAHSLPVSMDCFFVFRNENASFRISLLN